MHNLDLSLADISKIEGKASLTVKIRDGEIKHLKFKIAEYKRFYTQAIRGKDIAALPQLTARICGTCSNAHLLCAILACEDALGVVPSEQTKILRRLVNFGLIIRDHALHLYVFALPDILGIDSILDLDENNTYQHQLLDDTFSVKSAGNILGKTIGGRSVHAPYPSIGGFTSLPDEKIFPDIINKLKEARPAVLRLIKIFADCDFKLEREIDFLCLMDSSYSFLNGDFIVSDINTYEEKDISRYLDKVADFSSIDKKAKKSIGKRTIIADRDLSQFLDHVTIPYSHASGYKLMNKTHMVGALSRINLAKDKLNLQTQKDAKEALSLFPSLNIFRNNLAQAIEILHAIDCSIDILENLKIEQEKIEPPPRKTGVGIGIIEAPRGILFYKLKVGNQGKIEHGQIVVPTGQNQIGIEESIRQFLKDNLGSDREFLVQEIEKIIRAYDPCMSCASHFLKVHWL